MSSLPPLVLAGAITVAAAWTTSLALAFASFRAVGRRAVALAIIALAISAAGLIFKLHLQHRTTTEVTIAGGKTEVRTSGWRLESRWFFAASSLLSLCALAVALRSESRPKRALTGSS